MAAANQQIPRRLPRFSLTLPIRVEGRIDGQTGWNEITRLTDVSAFGAGFNLKRVVRSGRLVQLTMPLPRQMRCYDYAEPQYKVWGLVRSCIARNDAADAESNSVGVAFIGKRPPESYLADPNRLYTIARQDDGKLWQVTEAATDANGDIVQQDLRRHSRLSIPTEMSVEKLDVNGEVIASERTVTENLSLSGAAVFSMLDVEIGEFVRVESTQYSVSIISVVRARRIGTDGIPRLHIEFVDRLFPLEGIE